MSLVRCVSTDDTWNDVLVAGGKLEVSIRKIATLIAWGIKSVMFLSGL